MRKPHVLFCLLLVLTIQALFAAAPPEAAISNGIIDAKLYLPDPVNGYYRATRFDWSGVIYSLQYKGHEYFGQWFERYDPKIADAITGPVEEFRTNDAGLGYDEAKTGDLFVRIGVGTVRKPEERGYRFMNTYDLVDTGRWKVRPGKDKIEFVHELTTAMGYGYVYKKIVRLVKDKPELVLEHSLKNTGKKTIDTAQYNHNFFMIDKQPTGPDALIKFAFDARASRDLRGVASVGDRQLTYHRELKPGESVFTELTGFGANPSDYDIRIENRKAGAGVRITSDQPIWKFVFWSIRTTPCPEPYVHFVIEPGGEAKWQVKYEFYELPQGVK